MSGTLWNVVYCHVEKRGIQKDGTVESVEMLEMINGRSPGSNTWRYVFTYHMFVHILGGYSLKFRPEIG